MNLSWKKAGVAVVTLIVGLTVLGQSPAIEAFINNNKQPKQAVLSFKNDLEQLDQSHSEMKRQLEREAVRTRIPAVNARIDRVWKAIPGYNGWEIDVEQSMQWRLRHPENNSVHYIWKQTLPEVQLNQLPPNPIYKGNPDKPMAAFAINVAWGDPYINKILDILLKNNVKASFFLDGSWLNNHRQAAEQIAEAGHELSNHGYSHKNMSTLPDWQARQEITKTEALLKAMNVENKLFAPPSGDYDADTVRIAADLQLQTILWTIDTVDWKHPSADWIIRRIIPRLENGSIILMHPTDSSSAALQTLITEIKRRGYTLGTVSELISSDRVVAVE